MSLAQTQDTLTQDPGQLQHRAGQGDLFAMAKLYKILQSKQAAQVQQGLAQQTAPPVKDQIMQAAAQHAAAPPPVAPMQQPPEEAPAGIAAASGGFIQRRFTPGGQALSAGDDNYVPGMETGTSYADAMSGIAASGHTESPEESAWLKVPRAIRDLFGDGISGIQGAMGDPSWSKLGDSLQDIYTKNGSKSKQARDAATARAQAENPDIAAQLAARLAVSEPAPNGVKPKLGVAAAVPQVAVKPTGPKQTGSGLADALPQDVAPSPSGPPNRSKVDAASVDQPADTPYQDRAAELLAQLSGPQQEQIKHYQDKKAAEEAAFAAAQAAKHDPNKFADAMSRIVAITHPFSHANVGARGNLGSLADGAYELSRTQQTQRQQQAREEAAHQQALLGIQGGLTAEQIHQLTGNYGITNGAAGLDDKSDLAHTKQDNDALKAAAALAERKRVDDAAIEQKRAQANKARGGAGGAMTPVAAARIRMGIDSAVDRMKDQFGQPLAPEVAENIRQQRYAAAGLPGVESATTAPGSTGDLQAAAAAEIARRAGKK